MTNTKFRKRALLSSVAMLLVALVALGSATFAWFSSSPNASAGNMTAGTAQSSNLLVKQYNADSWKSSITFTATGSSSTEPWVAGTTAMTPVTTTAPSATYTDWKSATAPSLDYGKASANVAAIGGFSGYVAVGTLYIKYGVSDSETAGSGTHATTVTVNFGDTSKSSMDYVRVAFVPMSAALSPTGAVASGTVILGKDNDDHATAPDTWKDGGDESGDTIVTATGFSDASLASLTTNKAAGYYVFVWFEGTDEDCIDSNVGDLSNISFSFTAAP